MFHMIQNCNLRSQLDQFPDKKLTLRQNFIFRSVSDFDAEVLVGFQNLIFCSKLDFEVKV